MILRINREKKQRKMKLMKKQKLRLKMMMQTLNEQKENSYIKQK